MRDGDDGLHGDNSDSYLIIGILDCYYKLSLVGKLGLGCLQCYQSNKFVPYCQYQLTISLEI